MSKNKKILALSLGLVIIFSSEELFGMKRKLETIVEENDSDFEAQDEHLLLQKQMGLEGFYNNTQFVEQGNVCRIDQEILSISNKNNNVDTAYKTLLAQVKNLVVLQVNLDEQQDDNGNTLLHYAVRGGYEDIVQLLVDNGADSTISNNGGDTPFTLALNEDRHSIARFLMDNQLNY